MSLELAQLCVPDDVCACRWIYTMGGVPIPMELTDSPVLPTTGRQLPAVQFAKLVRLAGACAVSQGLYRAYGYEIEWGPHSYVGGRVTRRHACV